VTEGELSEREFEAELSHQRRAETLLLLRGVTILIVVALLVTLRAAVL